MSDEKATSARIVVTESAVSKVWSLMAEEENAQLVLRAYITGGGCSGFQYGFTFEDETSADDRVSEHSIHESEKHLLKTDNPCVRLAVDPVSWQYLKGATIDYVQDINGERFVIKNPNAKTTCGCGSSFSA